MVQLRAPVVYLPSACAFICDLMNGHMLVFANSALVSCMREQPASRANNALFWWCLRVR